MLVPQAELRLLRISLLMGLAAFLLLMLVGCASIPAAKEAGAQSPKNHLNLRPAGTPDIVIIDFSGRCSWITHPSCLPPYGNSTYLARSPDFTRQNVASAFRSLGYTVQSFDASAFVDEHYSSVSKQYVPGYAEATAFLEKVEHEWIANYVNPTRVVVLAHSHGGVWASLLIWNHPNIRFAYAIYMDPICSLWWDDNMGNQPLVQDYYHAHGVAMPWPLQSAGKPCDLQFPNLQGAWDITDVVPWNVAYGLEVHSSELPTNVISDRHAIVRPDGSNSDLFSYHAFLATHSEIARAGSPAMDWVTSTITSFGLPPLQPNSAGPAEPPSVSSTTSKSTNGQAPGIAGKPRLGVSVIAISAFPAAVRKALNMPSYGVVVMTVAPGGPAQKAGLIGPSYKAAVNGQSYPAGEDIILEADGERLTSTTEIQKLVLSKSAGDIVRLLVWNHGRTRIVNVRLEVVPQ